MKNPRFHAFFFSLLTILVILIPLIVDISCFENDQTDILNLKVGFYENEPKIFTDENGANKGFFPEILEYIASKEGWNIEYIYDSWDGCLNLLENSEIDIMQDVGYSVERAKKFDFNNRSLITSWAHIYTLQDSEIETLQDIHNKKIGVMKNDIDYIGPGGIKNISEILRYNCTFYEYDNYSLVFESLIDGNVDAVAVNNLYGDRNAYKYNAKKTSISFNRIDFKFAFPKNSSKNKLLIEKIDYWIEKLKENPDSIFYKLENKYLSVISDSSIIPIWIYFLIFPLIIFGPLTIAFLESQVRKRTKELKKSDNNLKRDIIFRKTVEKKLKESQIRFKLLVRQSPLGFIEISKNLKIISANPASLKILGLKYEKTIGKKISRILENEILLGDQKSKLLNFINNSIKKKKVQNFRTTFSHLSRDPRDKIICEWLLIPLLEGKSKINSVFSIIQDITKRIKMEDDHIRKQKVESISILAGGIAHDFNNMLMVLSGNINIMQLKDNLPKDFNGIFNDMEKVIKTASNITQQLLTFSKGGVPVKKPQNVLNILKESISLSMHGSNCTYSLEGRIKKPICEVDKGQIIQVFNNIILNAIQAMPNGGKLRIIIKLGELKHDHIMQCSEGKYVMIKFQDEGVGISDSGKENLFVPYYSTKPNGHGLGLPVCFSILEKHGGYITFTSNEEIGTTFTIYLPISKKEYINNEVLSLEEGDFYINGNVLVMDDEESVRKTIGSMLSIIGLYPTYVKDGEEAIQKYKEKKNIRDPFLFVIFDLTVPGKMGGKEAIKRLISFDPNIKAIVTSGYSTDPVMAHYKDYGFVGILPKPFSIQDLKKVLIKIIPTFET